MNSARMNAPRYVITGTDTDVGKTIFSAGLMLALEKAGAQPHYWKPIQSGIIDAVDTKTVQQLSNLSPTRFFAEHYIFSQSLSPHRAAEIDNTEIDIPTLQDKNTPPTCDGALIIEGAGGLMVPLTRKNLQINVFKKWKIPLILCARTSLGTINHTLLSLEAIWTRRIPLKGIAFIGAENEDTIRTIKSFSHVKILGRLPMLEKLDKDTLSDAFHQHFKIEDFMQ